MSYILEFTKVAIADIDRHKKAGDKAVLKKIAKLLSCNCSCFESFGALQ